MAKMKARNHYTFWHHRLSNVMLNQEETNNKQHNNYQTGLRIHQAMQWKILFNARFEKIHTYICTHTHISYFSSECMQFWSYLSSVSSLFMVGGTNFPLGPRLTRKHKTAVQGTSTNGQITVGNGKTTNSNSWPKQRLQTQRALSNSVQRLDI